MEGITTSRIVRSQPVDLDLRDVVGLAALTVLLKLYSGIDVSNLCRFEVFRS